MYHPYYYMNRNGEILAMGTTNPKFRAAHATLDPALIAKVPYPLNCHLWREKQLRNEGAWPEDIEAAFHAQFKRKKAHATE